MDSMLRVRCSSIRHAPLAVQTNCLQAFSCPWLAAMCSGAQPSASSASTSTPLTLQSAATTWTGKCAISSAYGHVQTRRGQCVESAWRITGPSPLKAAMCSGV